MADTESATMLDYLREPAESPSDAPLDEESLPRDEPLDDGQSPEDQEGPSEADPDTEEPEPEDQEGEVAPEEVSSPESPAVEPPAPQAQSVNWDDPSNPYFVQMQELQRLAAEQREKQEQEKQDERYKGAIKGLIEVDENDVDALADDLIEDIRINAVTPYQQEIQRLAHGMTALVAALDVLPPEQQEVFKKTAAEYRQLGETPEAIEAALKVRRSTMEAVSAREKSLQEQLRAAKGELAKLAAKRTGADRTASTTPKGPVTPSEETLDSYLRGTDEEGRSLYGVPVYQARTG